MFTIYALAKTISGDILYVNMPQHMLSTPTKSILVIEDSDDIRDLIRLVFAKTDYRVTLAANGVEGLTSLENMQELPGVILLDLNMAKMSGEAFLSKKNENPQWQSIPVILVSGQDDVAQLSQTLRTQGYIRKPAALDTYVKVAQKFCHIDSLQSVR